MIQPNTFIYKINPFMLNERIIGKLFDYTINKSMCKDGDVNAVVR